MTACVHPGGLNDAVTGVRGQPRKTSAVGTGSFDDPQDVQIAAGAAADPRDGTGKSLACRRELGFVEDLTMRAVQD